MKCTAQEMAGAVMSVSRAAPYLVCVDQTSCGCYDCIVEGQSFSFFLSFFSTLQALE